MHFPVALSILSRAVLSAPRRIAAALVPFAIAAGVQGQITVPPDPLFSGPAPSVAASVGSGGALNWTTGDGKSYLIPAAEVPGFLAALSIVDRITIPDNVYDSTFDSTWEHLHEQHWVFDTDPFGVNQFGHPYQGATMFAFARSSGVSFWPSLIYNNVGSFIWKMAGETDLPSINDQIATGIAGAFLGESLFRMSSLLLEGGGEHPGTWREVGAAVISPPTGFNRLVFGNRFKAVFPSYDPATFMRLRFGAEVDANVTSQGVSNPVARQEGIIDFTMEYGLPGKNNYEYNRPFDYFSFEFAGQANLQNLIEDIMVRGLLYGSDYELGPNFRGIQGLYGSYDYISPNIFRVSSSALSYGTTGQWWLSKEVALQGTALAGVGFAGAGTTPIPDGQRDYHYGIAPQGLLALRAIFGKRVMMDLTGREYYVSGTGSDDATGSEQIFRGDVGLTFRIVDQQAIGIQFVESNRHAHYQYYTDTNQSEGAFSLVYTFLGRSGFGRVEWRNQ
jgi:hypothetical protein